MGISSQFSKSKVKIEHCIFREQDSSKDKQVGQHACVGWVIPSYMASICMYLSKVRPFHTLLYTLVMTHDSKPMTYRGMRAILNP